ncbi:hypothetical protein V8E36_006306 [Tilletia maclaganii]
MHASCKRQELGARLHCSCVVKVASIWKYSSDQSVFPARITCILKYHQQPAWWFSLSLSLSIPSLLTFPASLPIAAPSPRQRPPTSSNLSCLLPSEGLQDSARLLPRSIKKFSSVPADPASKYSSQPTYAQLDTIRRTVTSTSARLLLSGSRVTTQQLINVTGSADRQPPRLLPSNAAKASESAASCPGVWSYLRLLPPAPVALPLQWCAPCQR